MPIPINLVFEDELSEFVLIRILNCFENKFFIGTSYNGHGFGYIRSKINGFNQACVTTPFIVLTDLDQNPCPLEIIKSWFKTGVHPNMIFRVAVREVEAWLLADIEGFSSYTGVSKTTLPRNPEDLNDPKATLISLAKRSRIKNIREDITPINSNARIGPNYNGRLMEFVINYWDVDRAKARSNSLKRAYDKLEKFRYFQKINS